MISNCSKCGHKLPKSSAHCKRCKTENSDLQLNSKESAKRKFADTIDRIMKDPIGKRLVGFSFSAIIMCFVFIFNRGTTYDHSERSTLPPDSIFTRIGGTMAPEGTGEVDFLLVKPSRTKNKFRLRTACRVYADKHRSKHANLMIWSDPKMVPLKLPLDLEQTDSQVAKYIRNVDARLDAFYVYDRGASHLFDEPDTD